MENQKGITLISLVITIILLIILTFTITVNTQPVKEQRIRSEFELDLTSLSTEIEQYYLKKKELPVLNKYTNTSMLDSVKNPNDGQDYYIIDIRELDVNLNYGNDFETVLQRNTSSEITDLLDVYIVNAQSHTVYYPKGIVYKDTTYYKLADNYTNISMNVIINSQNYVGEYDGNAHTATIEVKTEGATIKYGTTEGTYNLNQIPTYTEVGTYTIYYQAIKEGYNSVTGSVQVQIKRTALQVGDIVSYSPSGTYSWDAEYATSYETNSAEYESANQTLNSASGQSFNINSWKVLSIESGQVEMVPTAQTSGTVTLQGAQGYNNAVKLLNDACSSLYSNSTKGITARSINIEDIEKIIINQGGYDPTTFRHSDAYPYYGEQYKTQYAKQCSYYPTIYGQEKNRVINGSRSTSGLDLSEQTSLISRTANNATNGYLQASTSIQPYQTYYNLNSESFQNYLGEYQNIIIPQGASTTYWVASRMIAVFSSAVDFMVRSIHSRSITFNYLFYSDIKEDRNASHTLFPVVSLNINSISGNATDGFRVD